MLPYKLSVVPPVTKTLTSMLLLGRISHLFHFHHSSLFLSDGSEEGTFLWLFVTWLGLIKTQPSDTSRSFPFDFSSTEISLTQVLDTDELRV